MSIERMGQDLPEQNPLQRFKDKIKKITESSTYRKVKRIDREVEPSKKFRITIEMEGRGKDGTEIEGSDLSDQVEIAAESEDEARDFVFNKMDFGNKVPTGYVEIKEVGGSDESHPPEWVQLGK